MTAPVEIGQEESDFEEEEPDELQKHNSMSENDMNDRVTMGSELNLTKFMDPKTFKYPKLDPSPREDDLNFTMPKSHDMYSKTEINLDKMKLPLISEENTGTSGTKLIDSSNSSFALNTEKTDTAKAASE
jgi:hypothetical protein